MGLDWGVPGPPGPPLATPLTELVTVGGSLNTFKVQVQFTPLPRRLRDATKQFGRVGSGVNYRMRCRIKVGAIDAAAVNRGRSNVQVN